MEYLKFTRELHAYLKDAGIQTIFNFGVNDEFDYLPTKVDGKDLHLLFPLHYYPRLHHEISKRRAGMAEPRFDDDLKPGEYWKYEYNIDSRFIELFFESYDDRVYCLVIDDYSKKFLKYPKSYKTWKDNYRGWNGLYDEAGDVLNWKT